MVFVIHKLIKTYWNYLQVFWAYVFPVQQNKTSTASAGIEIAKLLLKYWRDTAISKVFQSVCRAFKELITGFLLTGSSFFLTLIKQH